MTVTVSVDSFKGSVSTFESAKAISKGICAVFPNAKIHVCPLADGGEGTVEAIVTASGGEFVKAVVTGPLGKRITAVYGISGDKRTAIIEMSAAAGITLVEEKDRNPMYTTTFGVGEMILDALDIGCRYFVVGIGGSATNDGGAGMLQALGYGFFDEKGNSIPNGAAGLEKLCTITTDKADKRLEECTFQVACDVKNPLCGSNGCSKIFGPQKGATLQMTEQMDKYLENYARLTSKVIPSSDPNTPGTGAAGGMGYAFVSYLGASLTSGAELVISKTGLEEYIRESDIVVTGEGRLDGQTVMGKAPICVARLAKKYGKTVIAFCGTASDDAKVCNDSGIDAYFPILTKPCSLDEALDKENALNNLEKTSEQVFRLINKCNNL